MSAKLYFRYGAMGSSKTANALIARFNYEENGMETLLLKPAIDTRDGEQLITSRVGLQYPCKLVDEIISSDGTIISEEDEIRSGKYACIIIDEAQFLTKAQVDTLAVIVDDYNVPVMCYGLRADFRNEFFPGSARLMAIADKIEEVKTICWCGRKATCNARYNEYGLIKEGEQIVLGSNEKYTALCRKHFREGNLNLRKSDFIK